MITDTPLSNIGNFINRKSKESVLKENQVVVGSGKSAISILLKYLRLHKFALNNKMSPILAPPWMGKWVYATILDHAFPVMQHESGIEAVYVYHQFGYEQDMDYLADYAEAKQLPIIEDCAHSLCIVDKKINIGHANTYSFASPPKFVASLPIGIIETDDKELQGYINDQQLDSSSILVALNMFRKYRIDASIRKGANRSGHDYRGIIKNASTLYASYPFVHRSSVMQANGLNRLIEEFDLRVKRVEEIYQLIHNELLPAKKTKYHLNVPFKVPVFLNEEQRIQVNGILNDNFLNLQEVHFDRNQNMLRSNYVRCICIPIQSQISDADFTRILEIIQSKV